MIISNHQLLVETGVSEKVFRRVSMLYFGDPTVEHVSEHWVETFVKLLKEHK